MMKEIFFPLLSSIILCCGVSGCRNKSSIEVWIPAEELSLVTNEFEDICEVNPGWKMESADKRLTIYTVQDSIADYPSMCLILYHDGDSLKAVSEPKWRKHYGIKSEESCPLFSNGHRRLYTIVTPKESIYVIVTEELLEGEYVNLRGDYQEFGMCVYAHAYTIKNGQLQPKNVFSYPNGKRSYITECDTTLWVEWVHDVPSVWPARYDQLTRTLEIAKVYPITSFPGMMFTKQVWCFDDVVGFKPVAESLVTGHQIGEKEYTVAMTEMFPRHKIQISYDGNCKYQYASWPATSDWTENPSIVVPGGEMNEKDGSYCFRSENGYEYIVLINPTPEGPWPALSSMEVRKDGKILYKEEYE